MNVQLIVISKRVQGDVVLGCNVSAKSANDCTRIIIIIINDIYRAQNSQVQQMRQVSCCMISYPRTGTFSVVS